MEKLGGIFERLLIALEQFFYASEAVKGFNWGQAATAITVCGAKERRHMLDLVFYLNHLHDYTTKNYLQQMFRTADR